MTAALLNPEGFRRRIGALIDEAIAQGRGDDLDRVVAHVDAETQPTEVNRLAALMYLIDEEYRLPLQEAIDAHRRWHERKNDGSLADEKILVTLREIYEEKRS